MSRVLGVIHARAGSVRVPRKNIRPLLGTPLLGWVTRAALASGVIDRLIVSSDDDEMMEAARHFGADAPFRRPKDLAEDVPSELVTKHALDFVEHEEGRPYDIVVTFQPTTPFVQPEHIARCIEILRTTDAASAVTASETFHPPEWAFEVDDNGEAQPYLKGQLSGERFVIQALPVRYQPNGAAWATRADALRQHAALMAPPIRFAIVEGKYSIDIDTPLDWVIAEAVGRHFDFEPTGGKPVEESK